MEGDRRGWCDGAFPGIVGDASFGWHGVSQSEFSSFIILCLSKVIGKIASSLPGRREERAWEERAEKVGSVMGGWFLTTPQHISLFLQEPDNFSFPLSNLSLSLLSLVLFSNLSLENEQENARNETPNCQMVV